MTIFEHAITWITFLLFASGAIVSIGLVIWEVVSMRRHPDKPWLRLRLRHIFVFTAIAAVVFGICTWVGWSIDTFAFTAAGLTVALCIVYFAKVIWRSRFKKDPVERIRNEEDIVVGHPGERSEKPAKRKRRPTSNKQPDYGRYGMWK